MLDLVDRYGSRMLWGDGHWGGGGSHWRSDELIDAARERNPLDRRQRPVVVRRARRAVVRVPPSRRRSSTHRGRCVAGSAAASATTAPNAPSTCSRRGRSSTLLTEVRRQGRAPAARRRSGRHRPHPADRRSHARSAVGDMGPPPRRRSINRSTPWHEWGDEPCPLPDARRRPSTPSTSTAPDVSRRSAARPGTCDRSTRVDPDGLRRRSTSSRAPNCSPSAIVATSTDRRRPTTSTSPSTASRSSRRRRRRSSCSRTVAALPGRAGLGARRGATRIDRPARGRHVRRAGADSRRRDRARARPIADGDRRPRESGRQRRPRRPPRALHGARRRPADRVAAEGGGGAGRAGRGDARLHRRGPRRDRLRRLPRHLLLAHRRRRQGGRPRRRVAVVVRAA